MKGKKRVFTKVGFTIIELLTVMSIIVILISLLVPSLNAVRRYAKEVRQKGQFHDIGKGLELFSIDFDGYPDSEALDIKDLPYCGAMKLSEAMLGQDGLGFHPDSIFKQNGWDSADTIYLYSLGTQRDRKPTYIDPGKNKICTLADLYGTSPTASVGASVFTEDPNTYNILCDVFLQKDGQLSGDKLGMPVLYYKADMSKIKHDVISETFLLPDPCNTYTYRDNYELINLVAPGSPDHPMYIGTTTPKYSGPQLFYVKTWNKKIKVTTKPYNADSYILISAGFDGLYGTRDDVFNFAK